MPPGIESPEKPELEKPAEGQPPKPEVKDKSTEERVKADGRSFIERITGKPDKEKPKEKDTKPPAAPVKRAVKKVDPPAPDLTVTPREPDYTKIAEAAGRGVGEALTKKEEKAKDDAKPKFSAKEQETLEILERMAKDYPEEADKPVRFKEGIEKVRAYREKWESEHPGEKFDREASEHDEFFEGVELDWDDALFARTAARVEAEKITQGKDSAVKKELDELKGREHRREQEQRVSPLIVKSRDQAARHFFAGLGEPFAKVLTAEGEMNREEVAKLMKEDPLNFHTFQAAEHVEAFAVELTKLSLTDEENHYLYPFQEKNGLHRLILDFLHTEQDRMKSLSDDEQRDEHGRRFLTIDEFAKVPPDQKRYFWHYTTDDLAKIFSEREVDRVKNIVSDFESTAVKRGFQKKNGAPATTAPKPKEEKKAETIVEKPRSPSGAVGPIVAHPHSRSGSLNNSEVSSFEERWIRRG